MHCLSRPPRATWAIVLASAGALLVAGCGGNDGSAAEGDRPLVVSAAASLTDALRAYGESFPGEERFSFAGSDELAAQIRQGAAPDVFASANARFPDELASEGLVEEPVVFARNELVVVVPTGSEVDSLAALTEPGLDLVIGAPGVPVGDYAREALDRLPWAEREPILANVRSEESDVKGVIGKVAQGAADAGFAYRSDVAAAPTELRAVALPERLRPVIAYGAAVVTGAADRARAERFVAGLSEGAGAAALHRDGFLPPP
jgi:molybdate transport system substrate-binding protein